MFWLVSFLVNFWLIILFKSDCLIFHWLPILKAGILPALHQRQIVWLVTPKNLDNWSTPSILSPFSLILWPFLPVVYHCLSLISSREVEVFYIFLWTKTYKSAKPKKLSLPDKSKMWYINWEFQKPPACWRDPEILKTRLRGETDITTGFGPVIGGSNPSGDTINYSHVPEIGTWSSLWLKP